MSQPPFRRCPARDSGTKKFALCLPAIYLPTDNSAEMGLAHGNGTVTHEIRRLIGLDQRRNC
jgi:hypothetical protein